MTLNCLRRTVFMTGLVGIACVANAQIDFFDNHDSSSTFTQTAISGGNPWSVETNGANAHTPDNYWRLREPSSVGDSVLTSPTLTYTATTTGPVTLSFWHKFGFEDSVASPGVAFDGGIVEIQVNGGTWTNIGAAAWTLNGYTDTISTGFSNPLAGQDAFSGSSPNFSLSDDTTNWMNSVAQIDGFTAGDTFALRFHGASDSSVAKDGWFIDEVSVTAAGAVPEPATMTAMALGALGLLARRRRKN